MELKGTVVFNYANVGSQSEGIYPFIYNDYASFIMIYMVDDNPFENNSLKPYDGKKVIIKGDYNDYGTFVVEEINEVTEKAPRSFFLFKRGPRGRK